MTENRTKRINLVMSESEYQTIRSKMAEYGIDNLSGYMRKAALDGCVIKIETKVLDQVVANMKRIGNNVNQLTKRANYGMTIDADEIRSLKLSVDEVWKTLRELIMKISEIIGS